MRTNIKVIGNAIELENEKVIRTRDTIVHFEDIGLSIRGDTCIEIVKHWHQTQQFERCPNECSICETKDC